MRRALPLLAFCLLASHAAQSNAQSSRPAPPVVLDPSHRVELLSARESIHAADPPEPDTAGLTPIQKAMRSRQRIFDGMLSVTLDVIVNENGHVDSAHAVEGPKDFYEAAQEIEQRRVFAPIVLDGKIVRAQFHDYVSVLPPETWGPAVPWPATVDPATAVITLQRTSCFGSCPAYTISITGAGVITFTGGGFSGVRGTHTAHTTPQAFKSLLDQFRAANFLSARDKYVSNWTDMPSETLTLHVGPVSKSVLDYGGPMVGMPEQMERLEAAVDTAANVALWLHFTDATVAAIYAEHWNFAANTPDNLYLYNLAITEKNAPLLASFREAHAPIASTFANVESPVCVASSTGNAALTAQLLALLPKQAHLTPRQQQSCLSAAAFSGSLPALNLWLDRGVRPLPLIPEPDGEYRSYEPPVLAAIRSRNPAILARMLDFKPDLSPAANGDTSPLIDALERGSSADKTVLPAMLHLLIAAGADVNQRDDLGRTPLFHLTWVPEVVPILIAAGADINARSTSGDTPLMSEVFIEDHIRAFLAAGADPTLRNREGKNAADIAHQYACVQCATVLEQAIKSWQAAH